MRYAPLKSMQRWCTHPIVLCRSWSMLEARTIHSLLRKTIIARPSMAICVYVLIKSTLHTSLCSSYVCSVSTNEVITSLWSIFNHCISKPFHKIFKIVNYLKFLLQCFFPPIVMFSRNFRHQKSILKQNGANYSEFDMGIISYLPQDIHIVQQIIAT